MMSTIQKWQHISLIIRIIIGLIVGCALALSIPGNTVVTIFGTIFVGLLKGVAPVLVFILVISALANASGDIGGRFKNVVFLYILGTLLAAAAAPAVAVTDLPLQLLTLSGHPVSDGKHKRSRHHCQI